MKNYFKLFFISTMISSNALFSQNQEKINVNLDFGLGANLYRYKYFDHNDFIFNMLEEKVFYDYFCYLSVGSSAEFKGIKAGVNLYNLNLLNCYLGYNIFELFEINKQNKFYFSINYAFLTPSFNRFDAFYPLGVSSSLIGFSTTYQFNKFELYYNFLKYRRIVTLNSIEHQHMLGVKYNIFKEK